MQVQRLHSIVPLVLAGALAGCLGDDDTTHAAPCDDAGLVWMPSDAGVPPRPDAGPPQPDAGTRVCFELPALGETELPRCAAETRDCVAACPADTAGDMCRSGCWAGDTYPRSDIGCQDCIYRQLLTCMGAAGCDAEIAAYLCCIVDNCPEGGDACISAMCQTAAETMFICGYTRDPGCFDVVGGEIGRCYAEGGAM